MKVKNGQGWHSLCWFPLAQGLSSPGLKSEQPLVQPISLILNIKRWNWSCLAGVGEILGRLHLASFPFLSYFCLFSLPWNTSPLWQEKGYFLESLKNGWGICGGPKDATWAKVHLEHGDSQQAGQELSLLSDLSHPPWKRVEELENLCTSCKEVQDSKLGWEQTCLQFLCT